MSVKYLCKFSKTKLMRFIGHLDLQSIFILAIRRTDLPIAFTQGFKPHIRMSIVLPLPVSVISYEEYLELYFDEQENVEVIKEKLNLELPDGIKINSVKLYSGPKLMSVIEGYSYLFKFDQNDWQKVKEGIKAYAEKETFLVERKKNKTVDIKKRIKEIAIIEDNVVEVKCLFSSSGSVRLDEIFKIFGEVNSYPDIERINIILKK